MHSSGRGMYGFIRYERQEWFVVDTTRSRSSQSEDFEINPPRHILRICPLSFLLSQYTEPCVLMTYKKLKLKAYETVPEIVP